MWYLWAAAPLLRGEKLLVLVLNVGCMEDLGVFLGHGRGLGVDNLY